MASVGVAQALAGPVVERAEPVVGVALSEHDLDLVVGVKVGAVGEDVQPTALVPVMPEFGPLEGQFA